MSLKLLTNYFVGIILSHKLNIETDEAEIKSLYAPYRERGW